MERKFYNRQNELKTLNERFQKLSKGELGVVYGRRRVGKSELLIQFCQKVRTPRLFLVTVTSSSKKEFMDYLSEEIKNKFNEDVKINRWEDFFDYFLNMAKKGRTVLILDEFQRLNNFAKEFYFSLQQYWDSKLKYAKIMLLICGSSMSMMHRIALHEHGPLYGRKTFQIHVKPFKYTDFREMFKDYSEEEKIKIFSIFGGTPKYLADFKYGGESDCIEAFKKMVLSPNGTLFQEPLNALRFELRNPDRYISILSAISKGNVEIKEISDKIGLQNNYLPAYIKTLTELLDILEPNDPIFGKKRNKRYKIKDNFFKFWYKFVYPHREPTERGLINSVVEKINRDFETYCGRIFEYIIEEFFIYMYGKKIKNKKMDFEEIGKWWDGEEDIDLILKFPNETVFVEVKYTSREIGFETYESLVKKAKKTSASGRFSYILVSKKGFKKNLLDKKPENLTLLSLEDLKEIWDRETKNITNPQALITDYIN